MSLWYLDYKYDEIAKKLKMKQGTIGSRINRNYEKILLELADNYKIQLHSIYSGMSESGPDSLISEPTSSRSSLIITASSYFSSRSARFSDAR